jgi:hypothetical protein
MTNDPQAVDRDQLDATPALDTDRGLIPSTSIRVEMIPAYSDARGSLTRAARFRR